MSKNLSVAQTLNIGMTVSFIVGAVITLLVIGINKQQEITDESIWTLRCKDGVWRDYLVENVTAHVCRNGEVINKILVETRDGG